MLAPETPGKMPPLAPQPAIDKLPAAIQTGIDSIFDLIKEEREKAANAARQEAWEARHAEREQAIMRIQEMEAEKVAQRGERESLRARIGELERELSRTGQSAMDALQDKHDQLAAHADQKIDALESRVGTLLEKLATTEKGLQDLEASYNDQALVLEKKTSEANDGAKMIADLSARVAELQAELASSRTWSDSITEQLRLINSGVGRQTQMLQATEEQRAESITKLYAAEQEIQALKTSSQVEAQKWEGERTALKSEIADLSAKHTTAIRKVETLQTTIDNNTHKFEQQRQYRKNKEAEAKTEKGRLCARITELEHALGRAGSRVQELEQSLADAKGQYGQLATAVNESGFIQVRDSTIVITAELINFVVALATHTAVVDQPQSLVNAPPMTLCATLTRCEKATLQMRDRNQELERQIVAAQDETRRAMTDLAAARAEKATTATTISGLQQENERLGKDLERVKEIGLKYKIALKAREGGCPKLSSAASGRPEARAKTSPAGCPSKTSSTSSMKTSPAFLGFCCAAVEGTEDVRGLVADGTEHISGESDIATFSVWHALALTPRRHHIPKAESPYICAPSCHQTGAHTDTREAFASCSFDA
ncbi:hypothetical protein K523DRAFT_375336 [Schizophyllum commune Tattone D]|nr:hypothetical protein K523DRAFT_375336 [Schizophyllum commune Tattone D]